jgi:hypothetical protein
MKGPVTERVTVASAETISAEAMPVGALVHKVANATAAIKYAASVLRSRGVLSDLDLAELTRIEEAAAMVGQTVKTYAATAERAPCEEDQPTVLYEICCDLAADLRAQGRAVYCRAYGDSRGQWNRRELIASLTAFMDVVIRCLPADAMMNLAVTGLVRHVRLDVHGLGELGAGEKKECLAQATGLGGPPGALMTVTATRAGGTTISLRLPR